MGDLCLVINLGSSQFKPQGDPGGLHRGFRLEEGQDQNT